MCPDKKQGGFAIVAAIFILVVLASLGAYMVTISSSHHIGSALDIEGSRALQAARAGMDWGIARAVNDQTFCGCVVPVRNPPVTGPYTTSPTCDEATHSTNLNSSDFPVLTSYTITVTCTGETHTDGVDIYSYALTATACNQPNASGQEACPATSPGANYIERRLTTQVTCNATPPC